MDSEKIQNTFVESQQLAREQPANLLGFVRDGLSFED
jgi:hypothetical protein